MSKSGEPIGTCSCMHAANCSFWDAIIIVTIVVVVVVVVIIIVVVVVGGSGHTCKAASSLNADRSLQG